jgi:hypothetical protein
VTVSLRECNGDVIAATSTDSGGHYRFDGLIAGRYQVEVALRDAGIRGLIVGAGHARERVKSGR